MIGAIHTRASRTALGSTWSANTSPNTRLLIPTPAMHPAVGGAMPGDASSPGAGLHPDCGSPVSTPTMGNHARARVNLAYSPSYLAARLCSRGALGSFYQDVVGTTLFVVGLEPASVRAGLADIVTNGPGRAARSSAVYVHLTRFTVPTQRLSRFVRIASKRIIRHRGRACKERCIVDRLFDALLWWSANGSVARTFVRARLGRDLQLVSYCRLRLGLWP